MQKSAASPKRRIGSAWVLVLVGICIAVSLFGWYIAGILQNINPDSTPAPDPFPVTDIVYGGRSTLGFIDADGSDQATFDFMVSMPTMASYWGMPYITGDDKTLLVTSTNHPGQIGSVFVAHPGEIAVDCKWWGVARLAADQLHILVETEQGLEEYSPDDCGTGKAAQKAYPGVFGALSPNGEYSAEVRQYLDGTPIEPRVIIHQIAAGEERDIGEGDFPAWSRDGQWLAYTGADGLYIVENTPNSVPRRLVALETPGADIGHVAYGYYQEYQYNPPIASWSPDGQWLVYHVYSEELKEDPAYAGQHYFIFKVNVERGEEVKLLDGGISPFWRWPVEGQ